MTITEFAESRGQRIGTVYQYIQRNRERFRDHITRQGRASELDDEAIGMLSEVYPEPRPVQVVQGIPQEEHSRMIAEKDGIIQCLQAQIIEMQSREMERLTEIADLRAQTALIEDRERQVANLTHEIERLRARGLWDRIMNK